MNVMERECKRFSQLQWSTYTSRLELYSIFAGGGVVGGLAVPAQGGPSASQGAPVEANFRRRGQRAGRVVAQSGDGVPFGRSPVARPDRGFPQRGTRPAALGQAPVLAQLPGRRYQRPGRRAPATAGVRTERVAAVGLLARHFALRKAIVVANAPRKAATKRGPRRSGQRARGQIVGALGRLGARAGSLLHALLLRGAALLFEQEHLAGLVPGRRKQERAGVEVRAHSRQ